MKPFLSDKTVAQSKAALLDKNMPVTEDKKIVETLNNFFTELAVILNIQSYESYSTSNVNSIMSIVQRNKEHLSKIAIKNT